MSMLNKFANNVTSDVSRTNGYKSFFDEEIVWSGQKNSLSSVASGGKVASARYKLTPTKIIFEAGLLSSNEEYFPLWAVRDMDTKQSLKQKSMGNGNLNIRLEHNSYTGKPAILLESIPDPKKVRNLIMELAEKARKDWQREQKTTTTIHQTAPTPQHETSDSGVADELTKLANL